MTVFRFLKIVVHRLSTVKMPMPSRQLATFLGLFIVFACVVCEAHAEQAGVYDPQFTRRVCFLLQL